MPTTHIFLGDAALTKGQTEALKNKLDKKEVELEFQHSQTGPDGRFLSKKEWTTADLWTALSGKIGFTPARKAKVTSSIDRPGKYPVEVEVNGYSYKGKISIVHDPKDKSAPPTAAAAPKAKFKVVGAMPAQPGTMPDPSAAYDKAKKIYAAMKKGKGPKAAAKEAGVSEDPSIIRSNKTSGAYHFRLSHGGTQYRLDATYEIKGDTTEVKFTGVGPGH